MSIEFDNDDTEYGDLSEKSTNQLKKQSAEKRRLIRENIELREMAKELGLSYKDFKDTLNC